MQYQAAQSDGILERMTPPTLRSLYFFWLMQVTQGEIDPVMLNDIILAGAGMLHRATINALELETLLTVRVTTSRIRHLIDHHRFHPVHGAVLRSLDHAERLLVRRSSEICVPHRHQRVGGIALVTAKSRNDVGIRRPR